MLYSTVGPDGARSVVTQDDHGFWRLETRILTIRDSVPVLINFQDYLLQFATDPDGDKGDEIKKKLHRDELWNKCPKIFPYQMSLGLTSEELESMSFDEIEHRTWRSYSNRTMTNAKRHACEHRAIWIRGVEPGFSDPQEIDYVTEDDLEEWPTLRELIADPAVQYSDQKSARDGYVTLKTIDMAECLGWSPEFVAEMDSDKLSNRMSIMARLDAVNWQGAPEEVHILHVTEEFCREEFGFVPADGIILANPVAMNALTFWNRKGFASEMNEGTKIRGGANMSPIKGTIQMLPEESNTPTLFVVEGGSLKSKIHGDGVQVITREEIMGDNSPFFVETPSIERVLRNPRFGAHMLNHLVSQTRNIDPELADSLVPRISERTRLMCEYRGSAIDYVMLCTYTFKGCPEYPKSTIEAIMQKVLDGDITVMDGVVDENDIPIHRADGNLYCHFGRAAIETPEDGFVVFGLNTTGRKIARGGIRVLAAESIRSELDPHLSKLIQSELTRRVRGCGGIAQGNSELDLDEVVISYDMLKRIMRNIPPGTIECWHYAEDPNSGHMNWVYGEIDQRERAEILFAHGLFQVAVMYWPSKFVHCLMRMRVSVRNKFSGAAIQVHPEILETLGGDSDGDLIYLIIEGAIVRCIPDALKQITVNDKFTDTRYSYNNTLEMTTRERELAQSEMDNADAYLTKSQKSEADSYVHFSRICEASKDIGAAFIARDIMADVTNWDLRVYTRMGQLCQEALGGLKMRSGGDVVQWFLSKQWHLSNYLGISQKAIPVFKGVPYWNTFGITQLENCSEKTAILRYIDMYKCMCRNNAKMKDYLKMSHQARPNALSVFEWMFARTRIELIDQKPVVKKGHLLQMANSFTATTAEMRDARYHLLKIGKGSFTADGQFLNGKEGPIKPQWNRWWRANALKNTGVPVDALKKAILEHTHKYPTAIENLGMLALLDIEVAEAPAIIAELQPTIQSPTSRAGDVFCEFVFGEHESLEVASEQSGVDLELLKSFQAPTKGQ